MFNSVYKVKGTYNRAALIYDANCAVCTWLALKLEKFVGSEWFELVANTDKEILDTFSLRLECDVTCQSQRDLHLVKRLSSEYTIYSGASAVLHSIAFRDGWEWASSLYVWPLRYGFDALYYIIKKTKKQINKLL